MYIYIYIYIYIYLRNMFKMTAERGEEARREVSAAGFGGREGGAEDTIIGSTPNTQLCFLSLSSGMSPEVAALT